MFRVIFVVFAVNGIASSQIHGRSEAASSQMHGASQAASSQIHDRSEGHGIGAVSAKSHLSHADSAGGRLPVHSKTLPDYKDQPMNSIPHGSSSPQAFDWHSSPFDSSSSAFDRSSSAFDRSPSAFNRSSSTIDRSSSAFDRSSNAFDRSPSAFDRSSSAFDGSSNDYDNRNSERPLNKANLLTVLYSSKQVDFVFPDKATREEMIQSHKFIPKNNMINDVDVYDNGRTSMVFITVPRLFPGVPVTLATLSDQQSNGSYLLAPYPDWASQKASFAGMNTIYRTHMDQCGRLWAVDSGSDGIDQSYFEYPNPPKIIIYDVHNNRPLGKYAIPREIAEEVIMLVTVQVDARAPDCSDAVAYIADSLAYKLIVFSLQSKTFWKINNIQFFPYPDHAKHTIGGVSFVLGGGMYGIFGMALGPKFGDDNRRNLYFHSFSSVKQSWADTEDLRNGSLWHENMNARPSAFKLFGGSRPSQSIVSTMDHNGIMFFVLTATSELACWNSRENFNSKNIVILAKDETALQANSGIKVYGNKLYLVTNRLQNIIKDQVNENEVNYRVLVGDVRQLTASTNCQVTGNAYHPNSENVF